MSRIDPTQRNYPHCGFGPSNSLLVQLLAVGEQEGAASPAIVRGYSKTAWEKSTVA